MPAGSDKNGTEQYRAAEAPGRFALEMTLPIPIEGEPVQKVSTFSGVEASVKDLPKGMDCHLGVEEIDPQVIPDVELAPGLEPTFTLKRNGADCVGSLLEGDAATLSAAKVGCKIQMGHRRVLTIQQLK